MTIALTGGTGFVGRMVLDQAIPCGIPLRALTRRKPPDVRGVEWVHGDLDHRTALARLTHGAQAVIHIAGLTRATDQDAFHRVNVLGTQTVLEAARAAGVGKLVVVSSLAAREPELSAYGRSKAEAEILVTASGLPSVIVRPPAVFGPRDADMLELFRMAKRGFLPLPPPGRASMINVRDLARLLLLLADPATASWAEMVGAQALEPDDESPNGYSHRELAGMICAAVGRKKVFAPHLPYRMLSLAAHADERIRGSRAKLTADRASYMAHADWVVSPQNRPPSELWRPQIIAREGLAQTARWYEQEGWL